MGQLEFETERNEYADDALWTGFAENATEEQVQRAVASAREYLVAAESAYDLVRLQAIRALSAQGYSTREIAGVVGISKSAVSRHLRPGVDGVAVRSSSEVASIVRQSWRGLTRPEPLHVVEEQAAGRILHPRDDEWARATEAGETPGLRWPYRLSVYKLAGDWATRDSLVRALGQSAWMAAAIARAGAAESCTLWTLWHALQGASTTTEYDRIVRAIHELAEQDRCWIEFVETTDH